MSYKVRYFPFAPGIPWKIEHGQYIVPELNSTSWELISEKKKTITVAAFSGLLETFFSFSILEAVNDLVPHLNLFWAGDKKFLPLLNMQGLAKHSIAVDQSTLKNFPIPVFFDKQSGAYINCLNNYIKVKTYYGTKGYTNKEAIYKQVFQNSTIPWENKYIPKFRNNNVSSELKEWLKISRIENKSFVIIIPDKTEFSYYDTIGLNWTVSQVKAFGAMLYQKNIMPIVFTNRPQKYYDSFLKILPIKPEYIINFLPKAKAIISKDIDFLYIANALSQAKIFSLPLKKGFDLNKNNVFLNKQNDICYLKELLPLIVFNKIMENI